MEYLFKNTLKDYQIRELEKRIPLISETVFRYKIHYINDSAYKISLIAESDFSDIEITQMLDYLLDDIYKLKDIPSKLKWERKRNFVLSGDTGILNNGCAYENSPGQVTLSGDLLKLFNAFNELFRQISLYMFNSKEFQFPVLLPTEVLKKAGYFEHTPYQWLTVSRIKRGLFNYKQFACSLEDQEITAEMCDSGYSMPPTMCYYVYDMLKNHNVNNSSFTTCGRSFRYEGCCVEPFVRLIDFTIRETVFIGNQEYVESSIDQYMAMTTKIMDILNLCGKCVSANDMFFMTDNTAARLNVQKMLGTKYELLLDTPNNDMIAVASFNKHMNYIGKRFNIHIEDEKNAIVFSSCVGVGLERMLYACVNQLGNKSIEQIIEVLSDVDNIMGLLH